MEYIKTFLVGGIIIGLMAFFTKYMDPIYAAMVYALPIEFLIFVFFLKSTKERYEIIEHTKTSMLYTLLFFIALTMSLYAGLDAIASLTIGIFVFIIFSYKYVLKKEQN